MIQDGRPCILFARDVERRVELFTFIMLFVLFLKEYEDSAFVYDFKKQSLKLVFFYRRFKKKEPHRWMT